MQGEALEELVASKLEQREPSEINEGDKRKARLSKYISSNDLKEFRYKVAKDLRKKNWEEGTLNSQKGEFELEKKTEWAKKLMMGNKKKARDISIKNEVISGTVHDEENISMASFKRVVTLTDVEKYKKASNGYLTYVPLAEHPGLYVLKQTLPVVAEIVKRYKPISSVENYYNKDKGILTDDKGFLVGVLKFIFLSID